MGAPPRRLQQLDLSLDPNGCAHTNGSMLSTDDRGTMPLRIPSAMTHTHSPVATSLFDLFAFYRSPTLFLLVAATSVAACVAMATSAARVAVAAAVGAVGGW